MKIVHLTSYYMPSMGYQENSLALAHQQAGHDITVVTSDRYFPFPEYNSTVKNILGERIIGKGQFFDGDIKIIRLPIRLEVASRVWLVRFKKTLFNLKPDVIICHGLFNISAIRLLFIAKKLNARIVFDEHTIPSIVREGWLSKAVYASYRLFLTRLVEQKASKIVGISDGCMTVLKEKLGFSSGKLEMISLGTWLDIFKPIPELRVRKRHELGISDEQIVVLYTGKIYEGKNAEDIIRAIDELNRPDISIVSVFVSGVAHSFQAEWDKVFSAARHRVIFQKMVNQSELVAFYNAADLAVWPGLPTISTIDASACGCPIICSDDLTERFRNKSGFGVKEGDYESFKNAFYSLLLNTSLRKKMGENAFQLAKKEFDWRVIAEKFIS